MFSQSPATVSDVGGPATMDSRVPAPEPPAGHVSEPTRLPPAWLVVLVVAIGLGIRFWILASPFGEVDSDEAVVGLMAGQFLDGQVATFFWGSNYGGTLDQMLTAGVFAVVGSSVLALKLVQVFLAGVACVLTWRVGRRIVGEGPARVAALLFWIAPAAYLLFSTKSRGWHWLGLGLALGIILACLRLIDWPRWQEGAVLGLLLGLAFWTSPALAFVVIPAVVYALARRPGIVQLTGAIVPAFVIGAAPWIRYNLLHEFVSLEQLPAGSETTYLSRLSGFFVDGLPMALGLKVPYSGAWFGGPIGVVAYGLALAGFVVFLARHRQRLSPLLFLAVAYPLLFAIPTSSFYVNEPRYVLYLAPVLALLAAFRLTTLPRQGAALAVALVLSVGGLASLSWWSDDHPGNYDLAAGDLSQVVAVLEARDIDAAWADYWTSYRLTFITDEEIVVASVDQVRHPPYQREVLEEPETAYIVHEGTRPDDRMGSALTREGVDHERVEAGPFAVYFPDETVTPDEIASVWAPSG